jgi:hypothetical protein
VQAAVVALEVQLMEVVALVALAAAAQVFTRGGHKVERLMTFPQREQ